MCIYVFEHPYNSPGWVREMNIDTSLTSHAYCWKMLTTSDNSGLSYSKWAPWSDWKVRVAGVSLGWWWQWEDVKPLQVLFHYWTWSWHCRSSIFRNTARQALYHRVGICYGQVQSRWKGAGDRWLTQMPSVISHRCGLIVWRNSRWRQAHRNLSTRIATDGKELLIAVDILTMNVYEIVLDNTFLSTTKCPKIALVVSTFVLPFVLDDADNFWISLIHQNVALVIWPKTSHGLNMSESLTSPTGTAAPGRYVLWDVENPRFVLQQPGVAPSAEKACFQGRSMIIHHLISQKTLIALRCNKRMLL